MFLYKPDNWSWWPPSYCQTLRKFPLVFYLTYWSSRLNRISRAKLSSYSAHCFPQRKASNLAKRNVLVYKLTFFFYLKNRIEFVYKRQMPSFLIVMLPLFKTIPSCHTTFGEKNRKEEKLDIFKINESLFFFCFFFKKLECDDEATRL